MKYTDNKGFKYYPIPIKEFEKIRAEAQEKLKKDLKNWKAVAASHQQCAHIFKKEIDRLTT